MLRSLVGSEMCIRDRSNGQDHPFGHAEDTPAPVPAPKVRRKATGAKMTKSAAKMSQDINKWKAARAEIIADEIRNTPLSELSPEEQEEKRMMELQEWREQVNDSENPNLVPLGSVGASGGAKGGWRKKAGLN
eukprot:TRINITY_DN16638_c0_g1_i9.p1 TRINITY_DN16638_c0_g1~~TRINITY_DN16638_c0_g1_i9.p1  ORF type:complete len:133 (+),score=33.60 TRINITY_DN16638_c0_g1_i9:125-523(+)